MAFNTPNFNAPTFGNPIPKPTLLVTTLFTDFLTKRKLVNQFEKRGDNKGFADASFEQMMRAVKWKSGEAWCAYYVKLIYMSMFSFDREYLSKHLGGGSNSNLVNIERLNDKGDMRYLASRKNDPQVGDIFCQGVQNFGKGQSGFGHTGIVVEILGKVGDGYKVRTVEGNTNAGGSREGDKSMFLTRTLEVGKKADKWMLGYIRRNFTQQEIDRLAYDEKNQTFIFK
jgi:hypothetical protein